MLYVIANEKIANSYGIESKLHVIIKEGIILNENELKNRGIEGNSLSQQAETLGGKVYTLMEIKDKIKDN